MVRITQATSHQQFQVKGYETNAQKHSYTNTLTLPD